MEEINLIQLYKSSFKENWELKALTDLNENTSYSYGELAKEIARMHILFEYMNIHQGDKIALIGTNHSSWVIVFMATITYGAIIVPILHEFHPDNMENIILHSDAKITFIDEGILKNINKDIITHPFVTLPSLQMLHDEMNDSVKMNLQIDEKFTSKYPNGFRVVDIIYPNISNESVVCINYISGSSTFTRGVMLTGNNYSENIISLKKLNLLNKGERNVAFLPMAHAFSCTLDILYGLTIGVHINILNKISNAKILLESFKSVKPSHISIVPHILEIIVRREKEQAINQPFNKLLLRLPLLDRIVYRRIRESLMSTFGGRFREMFVGGASLNEEVEDFLLKIKFPFSVGYGMTECAPIISMEKHSDFVPRSCGTVIEGAMKARINSNNPTTLPGEIEVKGTHVMKGYYKNPDATNAAFTKDGWFKTGDLGLLDKKNRLYIKGLVKTMLLGSNGQNIYQKEIETKLDKMKFVQESLVVMRNNGLIALVYPNFQEVKEKGLSTTDLDKIMKDNRRELNKMLARYERIGKIEIVNHAFEKTEENSMKRYLYV